LTHALDEGALEDAVVFWALFLSSQSRRPEYLKPGDVMKATIRSADGRIDLGEQMTQVL